MPQSHDIPNNFQSQLTPIELENYRRLWKFAGLIWIMSRLDRPVTAKELADLLQIDKDAMGQYLHEMAKTGSVTRPKVRGGWMLTLGGRSFFTLSEIGKKSLLVNPEKPDYRSFSSSPPPSNISLSSIVVVEEVGNVNPEKPDYQNKNLSKNKPRPEILKIFRKIGIGLNSKTKFLASDPFLTPFYIESHWKILRDQNKAWPGLLITILENHDPLPEDPGKNGKDYDCYLSGEFAPFIKH
jgi:hypothetical protein